MSNVNLNVENQCGQDVTFNVKFVTVPGKASVSQVTPETTPADHLRQQGKNPDIYTARNSNGEELDMNSPIKEGTSAIFLSQTEKMEGQ